MSLEVNAAAYEVMQIYLDMGYSKAEAWDVYRSVRLALAQEEWREAQGE